MKAKSTSWRFRLRPCKVRPPPPATEKSTWAPWGFFQVTKSEDSPLKQNHQQKSPVSSVLLRHSVCFASFARLPTVWATSSPPKPNHLALGLFRNTHPGEGLKQKSAGRMSQTNFISLKSMGYFQTRSNLWTSFLKTKTLISPRWNPQKEDLWPVSQHHHDDITSAAGSSTLLRKKTLEATEATEKGWFK